MKKWITTLALVALSLLAGPARAQEIEPNAAVDAAQKVALLIDAGKAGEVWDGASPSVKSMLTRDAFINAVGTARQPRGAVAKRDWAGVTRRDAAGTPGLAPGLYLNVEFQTRFGTAAPVGELISFRLDDDKTWRFTGYFLK